ncbi:MAG: MFS transporter [Neisseriales bacterium]|nr:MAG: MFS transporter [Neisseriales bacterium]
MKFASYKSQLIGLTIISGVICGYILGVIALVLPKLVMQHYITKEQVSLHVGALLLGCFIASIYTGSLADYLGRKKVILITMLIFIIGIIYYIFAKSHVNLYSARFIQGIAYGMCEIVMPLYLVEVSETKWRGQIITAFKLANTGGALISSLIWIFISVAYYPLAFAVALIMPLAIVGLVIQLPESPRWLIAKNKINQATTALFKINPQTAENALIEIQNAAAQQASGHFRELMKRSNLIPFLVILAAVSLNQLTGINVFVQNSLQVMKDSGIHSDVVGLFGNISISLVNFSAMIATMFLVDKIGRKRILIIGTSGLLVTLLLLFVAHAILPQGELVGYITLIGIIFVVGFFAFGPGALILVISTELLATNVRALAISIAFTVGALVGTLFVSWFGALSANLGYAKLFLIMAFFVFCYLLIALFIPETKGKSLEKINWKK